MPNRVLAIPQISPSRRLRSHVALMRLDHSVKQLFIVPGIVTAVVLCHLHISTSLIVHVVAGLVGVTLVASSNYVLNEILDAPYDRLHPTKCQRPAASGAVYLPVAYMQWLLLAALGAALCYAVSKGVFLCSAALWLMGCIYNIAPVRSKDLPYLDVISEAINNPLRFSAGWYMVPAVMLPPASLLIAYWMLGAYFMALKRFSEYRQIGPERAGWYRKSFRHYTEKSLLNSVTFYAASAMLLFGAFVMRYRLELVLTFPVIALLMAEYFNLSFEHDSAVQNPERLLREPKIMLLLVVCALLFTLLLFVDVPLVGLLFPKSISPLH